MIADDYLKELNKHLAFLYAFARQMGELDFAISLAGEFRGAQDPGWATTITAFEVYQELVTHSAQKGERSKADFRVVLMLYCQLAEAGGVYEALKNVMGVITLKPYLLWPFKDIVRTRKQRVIGPNANATFRDLAATANSIGMTKLSELLENAFRDDLRNGVSHSDYVIWNDGVRLPNRNGGQPSKLSFDEVNHVLTQGMIFFEVLKENSHACITKYNPPQTIIGRFSANFPMPWRISYDPASGAFGISGSSPGAVTTPEYLRQEAINGLLGGRVLALYAPKDGSPLGDIEKFISDAGFEPNIVLLGTDAMANLVEDISSRNLWDNRCANHTNGEALLVSPWGFKPLTNPAEFYEIVPAPFVEFEVESERRKGESEETRGP